LRNVQVRFVEEVAESEQLADIVLTNLTLSLGRKAARTVYVLPAAKSPLTLSMATRASQVYWIGSTPTVTSIDHNLAYLTRTRFLPNYDTSKTMPDSYVSLAYAKWVTSDHDINGTGSEWLRDMGTGGATPWIGPAPEWTTAWLYTFDVRQREVAFGHADLGAAYPFHFREGNPSKQITRSMTTGCNSNCDAP